MGGAPIHGRGGGAYIFVLSEKMATIPVAMPGARAGGCRTCRVAGHPARPPAQGGDAFCRSSHPSDTIVGSAAGCCEPRRLTPGRLRPRARRARPARAAAAAGRVPGRASCRARSRPGGARAAAARQPRSPRRAARGRPPRARPWRARATSTSPAFVTWKSPRAPSAHERDERAREVARRRWARTPGPRPRAAACPRAPAPGCGRRTSRPSARCRPRPRTPLVRTTRRLGPGRRARGLRPRASRRRRPRAGARGRPRGRAARPCPSKT